MFKAVHHFSSTSQLSDTLCWSILLKKKKKQLQYIEVFGCDVTKYERFRSSSQSKQSPTSL